MGDEDALPDWTLYEVLCEDYRPKKDAVEGLFKGESVSLFHAHHARKMILICFGGTGELEQLQDVLAAVWAQKLEQLERDAHNREAEHKNFVRVESRSGAVV